MIDLGDAALFAKYLMIADFLVPAHDGMPAFNAVCGRNEIGIALRFRPDAQEAFERGLKSINLDLGVERALENLVESDKAAFDAITLIVAGSYYMQQPVRDALGYPGQENVTYDPMETQSYLLDGSLGEVIARGRKYKPTPGLL